MGIDRHALAGETAEKARYLSLPLLIGILAAPPLFVWLLIRPGYAASTRATGFAFAGIMLALGLYRSFA